MRIVPLIAAALTLVPAAAAAHPGMSDGVVHGVAHLVDGIEHVLATVAVGTFAAWAIAPGLLALGRRAIGRHNCSLANDA